MVSAAARGRVSALTTRAVGVRRRQLGARPRRHGCRSPQRLAAKGEGATAAPQCSRVDGASCRRGSTRRWWGASRGTPRWSASSSASSCAASWCDCAPAPARPPPPRDARSQVALDSPRTIADSEIPASGGMRRRPPAWPSLTPPRGSVRQGYGHHFAHVQGAHAAPWLRAGDGAASPQRRGRSPVQQAPPPVLEATCHVRVVAAVLTATQLPVSCLGVCRPGSRWTAAERCVPSERRRCCRRGAGAARGPARPARARAAGGRHPDGACGPCCGRCARRAPAHAASIPSRWTAGPAGRA
jgi:hypothetical protein